MSHFYFLPHRCPEEKRVLLPVQELKFLIYRQINLTKFLNFKFHNERQKFQDDRRNCI